MCKSTAWFVALLALVSAGASFAQEPPAPLILEDAEPAAVARELSRALSIPVEVRGGEGRRVTLRWSPGTPAEALDRAAAALEGAWRLELRVTAGVPVGDRAGDRQPGLDGLLSIGVRDVPAARAFTFVARQLRAHPVLTGELSRRVSLSAYQAPAADVLDRLAAQAGVRWSAVYVITAPAAPPAPVFVAPARAVAEPPIPPAPAPQARAPVERARPSAGQAAERLRQGVTRVLNAPPGLRAAEVREFMALAGALAAPGAAAPDARELARRIRPTLLQWRSLYRGAAPGVQQELRPVGEVLERILRAAS